MGKLTDSGINARFYDFFTGEGKWADCGGANAVKNSDDDVRRIFSECGFRTCNTLADGKLFICGRGYPSYEIFDIKPSLFDYINIRKIPANSFGRALIIESLNKKFSKTFCYYCKGSKQLITGGVQLNNKKE